MDDALTAAVIVIVVMILIYAACRRLPARAMRAPVGGDPGGYPSQSVYAPGWADTLQASGAPPDEETVARRCAKDPLCAAIAYITGQQECAREGKGSTAQCFPHFWAYSLAPDANAVRYTPTDAATGPDLLVKRTVGLDAEVTKKRGAQGARDLVLGGHGRHKAGRWA